MKIVVCVKSVPDAESDRRFEDGLLVRGEDDVLNELDENAIEAAVSLAESVGGEVIAVTMGPEDAAEVLTRALQMGADRAILVTDPELAGADVLLTAQVLGQVVANEGDVDLVVTGMTSLDSMTSLVPSAMAEYLDHPFVGGVESEPEVDGNVLTVERSADGWLQHIKLELPAVISVSDTINEPRYPSFKDMKAARSKPIATLSLAEIGGPQPQQLAPLAERIHVVEANEYERETPPQIIEDDGNAGIKLAEYLTSKGI